LAMGILGNILFLFLPNLEKNEIKDIPKLSNIIKLFKMKSVWPLISLMSFTGIITAFFTGFLSNIISDSLS
jgi:hypothetical protein